MEEYAINMPKRREMIRRAYSDNFSRKITEEEIDEVLENLIPHMEDSLSKFDSFSKNNFERYINGSDELTFSPANIYSEISRTINEVGIDEFDKSVKYKRMREMEIATRFCIANYKQTGKQFMIKPQDNPDIVLVAISEDSSKKKFMEGYRLEVMGIPEFVKDKMEQDLPTQIAAFIKEKKFKKDYGLSGLIVSLDFNHQGFDFTQLSRALAELEGNPYDSVILTARTSEDGMTVSVFFVYPVFAKVDFNLINERQYLY